MTTNSAGQGGCRPTSQMIRPAFDIGIGVGRAIASDVVGTCGTGTIEHPLAPKSVEEATNHAVHIDPETKVVRLEGYPL